MKKFLTIYALITLSIFVFAQDSEKTLFENGINNYENKNFKTAQNTFLKILQAYPDGRLKTITKLMLAKSYYKLGEYSGMEIICNNFFLNNPNSRYLDDMHHLLGNAFYQAKEYSDAVAQWLWVVHNGTDLRLQQISGKYAFKTLDIHLTEPEIKILENKYRDNLFAGLITVLNAKKLLDYGSKEKGQELLRDFLKNEPDHFYAEEARLLLSGAPAFSLDNSFVYFKPSDGDFKEIADQIEQGMSYAITEYQMRNENEKINFQSVEIEESVVSALIEAEQKIKDYNPTCIIGPIDANQCAGFSVLSRYEAKPYIIPLSSGTGFTRLSPYAFQLNPDVETKGWFLGEYAVTELEHKNIAILAPVNEYGRGFVRSFVEAVQANGGEIVTDQWYYLDTQDFTRQFKAIRKKSFHLEFEKFIEDSIGVDSTWTEEDYQREFQIFMEQKFEDIQFGQDSTQIAATGIDAVLIIATPGFIPYLASQFAFHNIQCSILGNEGWNDPEQLKKFKQNIEGLIYITAAFFDPDSWNYQEFMNRFRIKMNATPEFYHLLGYDTMKWILQNYETGMSSVELKKKLENAKPYQGIIENINFSSKPRVNDQLKVIKFSFGQFVQMN